MSAKAKEIPKGSGKWRVAVNFNCKRKSMVCESKKEAEAFAREINKRIALGIFNLADSEERTKTFSQYADEWLAMANLKYGTMQNYKIIYAKHVTPLLDIPIDKITRLQVKDLLVGMLNDGFSMSYVKNVKAFINNVFDRALDDGVLQANPAARLKRLEGRNQVIPNQLRKFIPKEELSMILDGFLKYQPKFYAMALTLARTGMRIGEVAGMQWPDIDWEKRVIVVNRSRGKGGRIETPKSGKTRQVDMSAQLYECLKRRRVEMLSESVRSGQRTQWVFPGRGGNPLSPGNFTDNIWNPLLEKLGLPHYRVHDLRHSWASQMISLGHSLIYCQRQMGHSSIKITSDLYTHLINDEQGKTDGLDDERKVEKVIPRWKEM